MPERDPTAKPTVIAGTTLESGTANTGQSLWTQGGSKTYGLFSGTGANGTQIQLGAGRLDTAQYLGLGLAAPAAASGLPVIFYDAHTPGTGYVAASGHTLLCVLDPRADGYGNYQTFNSGALLYAGKVNPVGTSYRSGLNVSSLSGAAGFLVSYTSVVSG